MNWRSWISSVFPGFFTYGARPFVFRWKRSQRSCPSVKRAAWRFRHLLAEPLQFLDLAAEDLDQRGLFPKAGVQLLSDVHRLLRFRAADLP
jgi:hypothetical protein